MLCGYIAAVATARTVQLSDAAGAPYNTLEPAAELPTGCQAVLRRLSQCQALAAHLRMEDTSLYGMRTIGSDRGFGTKYSELLQTLRCPATLQNSGLKHLACLRS